MSEGVSDAVRAGLFNRALSLLSARANGPEDLVSRSEILHMVGRGTEATEIINRVTSHPVSSLLRSRCDLLVAEELWHKGNLTQAMPLYRRAAAAADDSGDVLQNWRSNLRLMERVCEQVGQAEAVALSRQVRVMALRCGDAQVSALTHCAFARMESRAGRHAIALRHLGLADVLLGQAPNEWIGAVAQLDRSAVLAVLGQWIDATHAAYKGRESARRSGWARGSAVGALTLAHLYFVQGRIHEAETELNRSQVEWPDNPSYKLAIADTRARVALANGEIELAERLLADATKTGEGVLRWYSLSAREVLARVLLAKREFSAALTVAGRAGAEAEGARLADLGQTLRLIEAEAKLELGLSSKVHLPIDSAYRDWPIPLICHYHEVLAKALYGSGAANAATVAQQRGLRVSAATKTARHAGCTGPALVGSTPHTPPDLDSAVALLELAGHPHVLGREAFATFQQAACCDAVALVASGPAGTRVVEREGWSDAEAVAAREAAEARDARVIPLGELRDETWDIVARPKPSLEQRCTFGALQKLLHTARTLDRYRRDEKQRTALWPAEDFDGEPESLWVSEQSADLLALARRLAPGPTPILITGETGTGKEMLARAIHRASDRATRPLLPFNCSAVPRDMLESQLFGFRRGAFTGADASFPGVIRAASGGTLFLDEIGEVGLDLQPKLLRFLDSHEVHPLGEECPVKVDVRIIAATNANLPRLVSEGRFREDLFYRLNILPLHIPPLRERREEIPPLAEHYLRRFSDEQRKGRLTISDELLEYLVLYAWPGNVRQLVNEMRRLVAYAEPDSTLQPGLLSPEILATRKTIAVTESDQEVRVRLDQPLPAAVEMLEQLMVRHALQRARGRVEEASRLLGISRKGLFLKRRRWGLAS